MNIMTTKLWYWHFQSRKKGEYLSAKYEDSKLLHCLDESRTTRIISILKWEKDMNTTTRKLWYGNIESQKKDEYFSDKYSKLLHYSDESRATRIISIFKGEKYEYYDYKSDQLQTWYVIFKLVTIHRFVLRGFKSILVENPDRQRNNLKCINFTIINSYLS